MTESIFAAQSGRDRIRTCDRSEISDQFPGGPSFASDVSDLRGQGPSFALTNHVSQSKNGDKVTVDHGRYARRSLSRRLLDATLTGAAFAIFLIPAWLLDRQDRKAAAYRTGGAR